MQNVKVFDSYGNEANLEAKLNNWLNSPKEPRKVLSIVATDLRLFVRWRPAQDFHRHSPASFKLFPTMANGRAETMFQEFFQEHPGAQIIFEAANASFLFWFWIDETA